MVPRCEDRHDGAFGFGCSWLAPDSVWIESGSYLLDDGALGTGGLLTVAEENLQELAAERGKEVTAYLNGQEINADTFAICKADLLLKGDTRLRIT